MTSKDSYLAAGWFAGIAQFDSVCDAKTSSMISCNFHPVCGDTTRSVARF